MNNQLFSAFMPIEGINNKTIRINGRVPNVNGPLFAVIQDNHNHSQRYVKEIPAYVAGTLIGDVTFDTLPDGYMFKGRSFKLSIYKYVEEMNVGASVDIVFARSYGGALITLIEDFDGFDTLQSIGQPF